MTVKRLGELLLDKGAIAVGELHTALEACQRTGGRLGTQLLRFGFVEERHLLEALSEQLGVPFVPESVLREASPVVRRILPQELMRRVLAVAFGSAPGRLQVAMANPRDPAALEEISKVAQAFVEPYVATESSILAVLNELSDGFGELRVPDKDDGVIRASDEGWERLWSPPQAGPQDLFNTREVVRHGLARPIVATFPALTPIIGVGGIDAEVIDDESFQLRMREVRHRDEVGELLLRYVSRLVTRLALFVVHAGKVVGWMAHGQSVVVDDVQSVELPLEEPSIFREVYSAGSEYVGPVPSSAANAMLVSSLGDPPPVEVVIAPVKVKDRTVAFLVGDIPGEVALAVPVQDVVRAVAKASTAFEILILKTKI